MHLLQHAIVYLIITACAHNLLNRAMFQHQRVQVCMSRAFSQNSQLAMPLAVLPLRALTP